ncbi:hypothetical protein [Gilvibacter sediminis]|uniref:hypothetical protein n=1 Tax=Gilvibacter sediminis TaxID=379071 RepID=UPI0023506690|nr:hypothetical protein [Gilvibacter sediminis]MDC7997866.1 hypothetical protein [Gilvibacter sediminis]
MKLKSVLLASIGFVLSSCMQGQAEQYKNDDFIIESAVVNYHSDLDLLIWDIIVQGQAGATTPQKLGQLDGAPVLGYVFPTTLSPSAVGFGNAEGILALALTSHPDFDDTPLWDENSDSNYGNDGIIWHPHWVVLQQDNRVAGGFSVIQFKSADEVTLPPTNPGMPMYMDSPGFPVTTNNNRIRVSVPAYRMSNKTKFNFDALTAYMQVNTSKEDKPMLGVYGVYSILSKDLSLPFKVTNK